MTLKSITWTPHKFFPFHEGRIGNVIVARCGRTMNPDVPYVATPLPILARYGYGQSWGLTAQEAMDGLVPARSAPLSAQEVAG